MTMKPAHARVLAIVAIRVIRFVKDVWEMQSTEELLVERGTQMILEIDSTIDAL